MNQHIDPRERAARAAHVLRVVALALLLALVVLTFSWEIWVAPLKPGGSWLALKALPLLAVLPGLLRARLYTLQWSAMLVLAYVAEGLVRGLTDPPQAALLGWIEAGMAAAYFVCAVAYVAPFKRAAKRAAAEVIARASGHSSRGAPHSTRKS